MVRKYFESQNFGISLGKELEADVVSDLRAHFAGDSGKMVFEAVTGTEEDLFQGTDLRVYGVNCDITYYLDGKDHMDRLAGSVELFPGVTVKFGVRTGNAVCSFETPVLVIGIDGVDNRFLSNWMDRIIECFVKHIDEIIEVGQSLYWDWIDAMETVSCI